MQAIENLTRIAGKILERVPHKTLADYDVVKVRLEEAAAVPEKANLLQSMIGNVVEVAARRDLLKNAGPGMKLRCRAKRTPDGAMCEKDPAPGDFEVQQ